MARSLEVRLFELIPRWPDYISPESLKSHFTNSNQELDASIWQLKLSNLVDLRESQCGDNTVFANYKYFNGIRKRRGQ